MAVQRAPLALLADQWEERKKSRSYNDTRTVSIEKFGPSFGSRFAFVELRGRGSPVASAYMERCQTELKRPDHRDGSRAKYEAEQFIYATAQL